MKNIFLFSFAASLHWVVYAQSLESRIQDEVEHFFPDEFMGSVLVSEADRVIYSDHFGYSNLDQETPLDTRSVFRIASLTKQFTSSAILLLEDLGALTTGDSITTHIQGLPNHLSEVTLLHLLSHTSGVSDIPNSAFNSDGNRKLELTQAELAAITLESLPGERARYSNAGYHLLGEVIESVSGMTFSEFISSSFLAPLELNQTGFVSTNPGSLAIGYFPENGNLVAQEVTATEMKGPYSAGGMYSSTLDLNSWSAALFGGKVLSQTSIDKLKSIQKDNYALGLLVSNENDRQRIYHTGSLFGFAASQSYYPDRDLAIIVLSNVNDRDGGGVAELLAKSIEYILFGDNVLLPSMVTELEIPQAKLASFVGEYSTLPQGRLRVSLDEDHLVLRFIGDTTDYQLLPLSDTTFHIGFPFIHYEFLEDGAGGYSAVVLHQRGSEFSFIRQ